MKTTLIIAVFLVGTATAEMTDRKETKVIIVHHSATEEGNVETFRNFHKSERDWDDVGYHFIITNGKGGPDGQIQVGRSLEKQGAHAKGRNHNSIGVCLVGKDSFTEKQKMAAALLITALCIFYDTERIEPHHEKCPGPIITDLVKKVRQYLKIMASTEPRALHNSRRAFFNNPEE